MCLQYVKKTAINSRVLDFTRIIFGRMESVGENSLNTRAILSHLFSKASFFMKVKNEHWFLLLNPVSVHVILRTLILYR